MVMRAEGISIKPASFTRAPCPPSARNRWPAIKNGFPPIVIGSAAICLGCQGKLASSSGSATPACITTFPASSKTAKPVSVNEPRRPSQSRGKTPSACAARYSTSSCDCRSSRVRPSTLPFSRVISMSACSAPSRTCLLTANPASPPISKVMVNTATPEKISIDRRRSANEEGMRPFLTSAKEINATPRNRAPNGTIEERTDGSRMFVRAKVRPISSDTPNAKVINPVRVAAMLCLKQRSFRDKRWMLYAAAM